jgi:hypothetical protein
MMVKDLGSWRRGGDVEVFFLIFKKKKNGNHKKKNLEKMHMKFVVWVGCPTFTKKRNPLDCIFL